jgi:hypothetical protein
MRHFIIILLTTSMIFAWGKTGHRIVGSIAEENLNPKAKKEITNILGHSDLARISNWMDEIRSDSTWKETYTWHYCTIEEGHEYEGANGGGLALEKIQSIIESLKSHTLSKEDEINAIAFLVHITADLHQPLHVGNGTDRGGNDVKVTWFNEATNLHRVWDSQMIDHMQYSYTEYAQQLQLGLSVRDKSKLLNNDVLKFVYDSRSQHTSVYDIGDANLSWNYIYKNRLLLESQLRKGGYHLAAILNTIYG